MHMCFILCYWPKIYSGDILFSKANNLLVLGCKNIHANKMKKKKISLAETENQGT